MSEEELHEYLCGLWKRFFVFLFVFSVLVVLPGRVASYLIWPSVLNGDLSQDALIECGGKQPLAESLNRKCPESANGVLYERVGAMAQEGGWRGTNVLAMMAVLQFAAGAFGLWFVYRTLSETRRTAEAAFRATATAESAERAWVLLDLQCEFYPATEEEIASGTENRTLKVLSR